MRQRRPLFELCFFLAAAASVIPLWWVRWPPIQDLPQHLAAVRILVDYGDPALRFSQHFELALGQTQYLAYYLVAGLLALPFGTLVANKLVVSAALLATPYAMRALLRALGRDERAAVFVAPLAWNAHLLLGFFNFIAALPLCLYGLSLAVKQQRDPRRRRGVGLALVLVVAFYTHVVPFALLFLGAALLALGGSLRASALRLLALLPASLAALLWLVTSPAGASTRAAAGLSDAPGAPHFLSVTDNLRDAPSWLTQLARDGSDAPVLVAWTLLVLLWLALGAGRPGGKKAAHQSAPVLLALLGPLAALLYFVTPASYDWIWPINARFALLALLFIPLALPSLGPVRGALVFGAVAALSLYASYGVTRAFEAFERDEVGDFSEAIALIPEGSRTAALIFDRDSDNVRFSPFLHAAAMLQAERGGAVMFTFADFPQSPVVFREESRPPRVPPRWEWTPERVTPDSLAYYDYVLTRGGPGAIATSPRFKPIYEGPHWRVYAR